MSFYRVLDENVSEKKSAEEPYRTLRGTVMKEERRKRKASFKDVGNDDNPFVVYIDPNVGRTRLNIFSKNVPEKLGGIVVPHVEESIIDADRLLVGKKKFERSSTKFQKHKSKKHPKTKNRRGGIGDVGGTGRDNNITNQADSDLEDNDAEDGNAMEEDAVSEEEEEEEEEEE